MTLFSEYFYEKYKHPDNAKKLKIEGEFTFDFYVNESGEIVTDSIKVISGVCKECDKLALKIIREAPIGITGHRGVIEQNFAFILSYKTVTILKE